MKYYCLNLERAPERRECMTRQWMVERGFELEFFPAVDRRNLSAGQFPLPYDPAAARQRCGRELSLGEVACATSHHLILQRALNAGHKEIVVLEDDIQPRAHATPQAFQKVIDATRQSFPHVSVLLLYAPLVPVRISETRDGISLLAEPPFGTCAMWMREKAMQLLVRDLATLSYPADWFWSRRFAPMKTIAMPVEPLCDHVGEDTYVGNTDRGAPQRNFVP